MNRCNNHEKAIATVATWWLSDLVAPAKAFHYAGPPGATSARACHTQPLWSGVRQLNCVLGRHELPGTCGGSGSVSRTCRGDWWARLAFLAQRLFRSSPIVPGLRSGRPSSIRFRLQMRRESKAETREGVKAENEYFGL
jgi:hypothetical protein